MHEDLDGPRGRARSRDLIGCRVREALDGPPVCRRIDPPRQKELQALVERIAKWIGRAPERQDILVRFRRPRRRASLHGRSETFVSTLIIEC
jgi:hypothetical protein